MKKYIQLKLIPAIKRWMAPPVFDGDPEKTRRAVLLNVIVILGLFRSLMIVVGAALGDNIPVSTQIFAIVWFILLLLMRRLLHNGKLALVTLGLTGILFIVLTVAILSLGTIRTPIAAVYLFWVVLIGTLFQWRGVVVATVVCSLVILGLILAENAGLLPQPNYSVGITQWFVFTALFVSGAAWSYYTNRITNIALERAEQEVEQRRRAEALLRAVMDNMTDPVMLKDAQGRFTLVNQALARRYNTTPEAMLGKHEGDFGVSTLQTDSLRQSVQAVLQTGQTQVDLEDGLDMASGDVRHYKSIKTPMFDILGQPQVLVVVQDMTEIMRSHKQVAESEQRLAGLLSEQRAILQSDVVGLLITQGSRMLWATPSLLRTLGYDWLDVEGLDIRFMFQSEDAFLLWVSGAYPVIHACQVFRTSIQLRHKNGILCWFDLAGTMFGEHAEQVLWSCVDISAQKMAEAKLIEAQQEALAATAAKSQFLAMMSHEVRTPMNGILGMAQLLVKPDMQDDRRVQYAQTILSSGHTLLSLLNDILDLSKVEAGKLKLESIAFAVDQVVGDIQALFAEAAGVKGLQLTSVWQGAAGQCYLGDPYRLRQMISNLVSNAIKFTAHGFVRIVARKVEHPSQHAVLEFSVSDSGIGVPYEQQARLFEPFSQADTSTTRRFGGTGLGLSIVSQLAHLMEGEVGIDSQPGQGARFWFRVRVAFQAQAHEPRLMTAASDAAWVGNLTGVVLVAEDNPVNRMVITAMLGELNCSGLKVVVVEDGQQALDHITQGGQPDLVLMDVQMPVMDGLTATERIRLWQAEHGQARLPIVALTASAFEEDRQKCLNSGMDDFLVKPLDIHKLQAMLTRWLPRSGQKIQLTTNH